MIFIPSNCYAIFIQISVNLIHWIIFVFWIWVCMKMCWYIAIVWRVFKTKKYRHVIPAASKCSYAKAEPRMFLTSKNTKIGPFQGHKILFFRRIWKKKSIQLLLILIKRIDRSILYLYETCWYFICVIITAKKHFRILFSSFIININKKKKLGEEKKCIGSLIDCDLLKFFIKYIFLADFLTSSHFQLSVFYFINTVIQADIQANNIEVETVFLFEIFQVMIFFKFVNHVKQHKI